MKKALDRIDKIQYKTMTIIMLVLFVASSIIRAVISFYPKAIQVYPDELRYIDISRSLIDGAGINVHNLHMSFDQILYPIFLIPFSFIKDQVLQINAISIYNSILISSVIFPLFLLGRRIIKKNSIVLLLLVTVLTLPDLVMSITFMSENLFYPLSAWLIYFVFMFWDSDDDKKKIKYCVLSAVFCFLAYLTKIVSAYFIVAFILSLGFDCLFTKKNSLKQNIKYCIYFCIIVGIEIIGYKLLLYLLLGPGISSYGGNRRQSIVDLNSFIYFFYANIYNAMFALIAFFYFPVVFPLFSFNKLEKSEKNLLFFATVALIVIIVIVSYSISLNEDYPNMYMRQHTRYYAPLLIIFLSLFYKRCFIPSDTQSDEKPKFVSMLTLFTIVSCLIFIFVFRFFIGVCIDGVLLQTISCVGEKFAQIVGDINKFNIPWQLLLMRSLLVIVTIVFTLVFFRSKAKKTGAVIFVFLIFAVSIANNYYAVNQFRRIYEITPDTIDQAIAVNRYINSHEGNVLIITDGYNTALDTYITKPAYWTKKSDILKQLGDNEDIDITKEKIISNYPWTPYENLNNIKYIVTDNSVEIGNTSVDKITIDGLTRYSVYRNEDTSKISFYSFFPKKAGQTNIITADQNILNTQYSIDKDGHYLSADEYGALIYGPYSKITSGVYDITFYYEYSGKSSKDKVIANAELYLSDTYKIAATAPMIAGENSVTLKNIAVNEDYNEAAVRIFTNEAGVGFVRVEITKVE